MNWRSPRVWIGACSSLLVLGIALVDLGRKAPGPISAVHGSIAGLEGDCSACHGGWTRSMKEACLECHEPIEQQLALQTGLHGHLPGSAADECATCHGEHYGAGFPLVNVRSFSFAGHEDPLAFDHAKIGFAMSGKHLELECTKCHESAEVALLEEGQHRFLGLEQDCLSCHEDPHEGRMAGACSDCHAQESFEAVPPSNHDRFLALVGGHGAADCRDCHAEGERHGLEELQRGQRSPAPRDCLACHESPHQDLFVLASAEEQGKTAGAGCVHCHREEHTRFGDASGLLTVEEHAASGFALVAPHADLECADCHAPIESEDYVARFPLRKAESCSACHDDPHGGQFHAGPFATAECTACHAAERFEPHAFTVEEHARASLQLEGVHAETDCNRCHLDPPAEQPRLFHGTDSRCSACHADAHAGFFATALVGVRPPAHGECELCHTAESFARTKGEFEHARWTGFPTTGAHGQVECEACHPAANEPDANGRRFGRVERQGQQPAACSTCHSDPHEGLFDKVGQAAETEGAQGCARCHGDATFRVLAHPFDHDAWTGHALEGVHASLACTACHPLLRKPTNNGRTWAKVRGEACADCHEDPHAEQFVLEGRTDCSRCHTTESDFQQLSFDHETDSRFALGEAHAQLECASCHKRGETAPAVVRYRPLPTACVDCHGRQDHPLRRGRGK